MWFSTRAASPSFSRRRPSRRCSEPATRRPRIFASSEASLRAWWARGEPCEVVAAYGVDPVLFMVGAHVAHDCIVGDRVILANNATLAGHAFEHEIASAVELGIFGSIDANRGDPQNGWDTDQFPNSVEDLALPLYEITRGGGIAPGGVHVVHLALQLLEVVEALVDAREADVGDLVERAQPVHRHLTDDGAVHLRDAERAQLGLDRVRRGLRGADRDRNGARVFCVGAPDAICPCRSRANLPTFSSSATCCTLPIGRAGSGWAMSGTRPTGSGCLRWPSAPRCRPAGRGSRWRGSRPPCWWRRRWT